MAVDIEMGDLIIVERIAIDLAERINRIRDLLPQWCSFFNLLGGKEQMFAKAKLVGAEIRTGAIAVER